MARRVLLVDDNLVFARQLSQSLATRGVEVDWLTHGSRVPSALAEKEFDVAVVEAVMPGLGGVRLVDYLRSHAPRTRVLVVAASASLETAVEVMKKGAVDYVVKPVSQEVLADAIRDHLDDAVDEVVAGRGPTAGPEVDGNLVGDCPAMRAIGLMIEKVALSDAPVLVCGESGTGKELVARAIHRRSRRAAAPFLAVNCGALAEGVIDSELFGHVRGAFTGARAARRGLFEEADGGSIFLDELPSTPLGFQVKLLRVLEDGLVRPIGTSNSVRTDVRVIAAANVDLREAVRSGRFRDDLYYRLNVVSILLPPLRERAGDIERLAHYFIARAARDTRRSAPPVEPEFLTTLLAYRWPGNVRELRNVIERAVLFAEDGPLTAALIPPDIIIRRERGGGEDLTYNQAKTRAVARFQVDYLSRLLSRAGGNITRAARAAGIPRQTLHRLLRAVLPDGHKA